ncbi:hypothetical protein EMCG_08783 [[Emmonsia] crescens]|uniref:Uncharacterized protein n=1 Tax=[Emmonsia] crescens TaxID=73230 RepID=A0A0G2I4P8_9EURO|nr:hypothetical protein EMCG_08783 [Emmonsia crescens UAMH 3008]
MEVITTATHGFAKPPKSTSRVSTHGELNFALCLGFVLHAQNLQPPLWGASRDKAPSESLFGTATYSDALRDGAVLYAVRLNTSTGTWRVIEGNVGTSALRSISVALSTYRTYSIPKMQAYYGAPVYPYRLLTDGSAPLCVLEAHQNQRPKPFVSRISKPLAQFLIEELLVVAKFLNLSRGVSCFPLRFGSLRSLKGMYHTVT